MGVINATPDSFYRGYLAAGIEAVKELAGKMISEGADILDIGGQSTRPGAERVSTEEEKERTIPVIEAIMKSFPDTIISIDTFYSETAIAAVQAGASIVNDISGGEADEAMISAVAVMQQVPFICMHMKGTPQNMQELADYDDITTELLDYFIDKIAVCNAAGIKDLIIDPGFGFAKTAAHNFKLLKEMSAFRILGKPLLAGLSRKSTVYRTLGITADEALNGTTVLNTIALMNGASILRVHDVKEAKEAAILMRNYKGA